MSVLGPRGLLALSLVLSAGAAAAVASSASRPTEEARRGEDFQRLVHGLGFGPAVGLSRCERDFDPRIGDACSARHEPVPAGDAFCGHHGTADPSSR